MKLVVIVTAAATSDKATVGFTIANAALSTGMHVAVFLTSDGIELARDGNCDLTHVKPFKPLDELIESFIENGGIVWACSPCYEHHGLEAGDNYEKVLVTGAGPLVEWIQSGASTISL